MPRNNDSKRKRRPKKYPTSRLRELDVRKAGARRVRPDSLSEIVTIQVLTLKITEKAILVDLGKGDLTWFPKSQCRDWPLTDVSGPLEINRWIAQRKGIVPREHQASIPDYRRYTPAGS